MIEKNEKKKATGTIRKKDDENKNKNKIIELDLDRKSGIGHEVKNKPITEKMFERVNKKLKKRYTCEFKQLSSIIDKNEKKKKKKDSKELKKSLKRLKNDQVNGDHIDLIERLASDGDDLISPNKLNSQNVMELILDEHELDNDDSDSE